MFEVNLRAGLEKVMKSTAEEDARASILQGVVLCLNKKLSSQGGQHHSPSPVVCVIHILHCTILPTCTLHVHISYAVIPYYVVCTCLGFLTQPAELPQ